MDTPLEGGLRLAISASMRDYACVLRDHAGRQIDDAGSDGLGTTVQRLLQRGGQPRSALQSIAVDIGPGSYTGLRVALTFAKVLHRVGALPITATTSLELIAATLPGAARGGTVRVILDARRERFHHAPIATTGASVALLEAPRASTFDELHAAVHADETLVIPDALAPRLASLPAPQHVHAPDALALAHAMLDGSVSLAETDATTLEPLYLMGSYADGV